MKKEKNIQEIIKSASNKKEVMEILDRLFNKKTIKDNKISNNIFFDRYFSLSLLSNEITQVEFEEIFVSTRIIRKRLISLNEKNSPVFALKLFHKFREYIISTESEFLDLVEALLDLYESILSGRSQNDLLDGVNSNNLRVLIIDLYKRSSIPKINKKELLKELLTKNRKTYNFLSVFLNLDAVGLFGNSQAERKEMFNEFRDLQWKYLQRSIEADNLSDVLSIMQQAHTFITQIEPGNYTLKDVEWFKKNIIEKNKEYLSANLKNILKYIKDSDYPSGNFSRQLIDSIFHDTSALNIFHGAEINEDAEEIVDYYDNLTLLDDDFLFVQQEPPLKEHQEYNDHSYPSNEDPLIFDLIKNNYIKIILDPLDTGFWRFAFRFSKNRNFPLIKTTRHSKEHHDTKDNPHLGIAIGQPTDSGLSQWENKHIITLDNYFSKEPFPQIFQNYNNEKIIIKLANFAGAFYLSIKTHNFSQRFDAIAKSNEYNSCILTAWCDTKNFKLKAKIKTGILSTYEQLSRILL